MYQKYIIIIIIYNNDNWSYSIIFHIRFFTYHLLSIDFEHLNLPSVFLKLKTPIGFCDSDPLFNRRSKNWKISVAETAQMKKKLGGSEFQMNILKFQNPIAKHIFEWESKFLSQTNKFKLQLERQTLLHKAPIPLMRWKGQKDIEFRYCNAGADK